MFTLSSGPHYIKSVCESEAGESVLPNLSGQMKTCSHFIVMKQLTPLAKTDDSLQGQKDTFNLYLETLLAAGSSDCFLVVPYKT